MHMRFSILCDVDHEPSRFVHPHCWKLFDPLLPGRSAALPGLFTYFVNAPSARAEVSSWRSQMFIPDLAKKGYGWKKTSFDQLLLWMAIGLINLPP